MRNVAVLLCTIWLVYVDVFPATLEIGLGKQYDNLAAAARHAEPGDTLLFYPGVYSGGQSVAKLQGTATDIIVITTTSEKGVIIRGGTTAWQLSDAAYVHISGFIFEGQTGNGVNCDDGGDYRSPAHHIIFQECTFRDINATGNNDLLKLSGVDDFKIENCLFENGSPNGSGIDMVGCHNGEIISSTFLNMGSNAIQAKGGTQFIRMARNWFENCGQRAVNLGGSTGLPFFRPLDAPFEAADLKVHANVFIGTIAPIAYVGCVRTEVINNTIVFPEKWVVRILQENVDADRFLECGDNSFQNNLIYQRTLGTETNIGPNTRPETFAFQSNFWFNVENTNWRGPNLPVDDPAQIINKNPNFVDVENNDFSLQIDSPASGLVNYEHEPLQDYNGVPFQSPRSVGAFEGGAVSGMRRQQDESDLLLCRFVPNPCKSHSVFHYQVRQSAHTRLRLYDLRGRFVEMLLDRYHAAGQYNLSVDVAHLPTGVYLYEFINGADRTSGKIIIV